METIRIIGGVVWPSTIVHYRAINEETAKRLGGYGLKVLLPRGRR